MVSPDEIAKVTNNVYDWLDKASVESKRLESDKLRALALESSCNLLTKLVESNLAYEYDKAVKEGDVEAFRLSQKKSNAIQTVTISYQDFDNFWEQEMKLLRAVGFDEKLVQILEENKESRMAYIRESAPEISGSILKGQIQQLQIRVCNRRDQMIRVVRSEPHKRNFLLGLLGIGLVSANLMPVFALGQLYVGASCSSGGALAVHSIKELIHEIPKPFKKSTR